MGYPIFTLSFYQMLESLLHGNTIQFENGQYFFVKWIDEVPILYEYIKPDLNGGIIAYKKDMAFTDLYTMFNNGACRIITKKPEELADYEANY